jgi:hypothetical protein
VHRLVTYLGKARLVNYSRLFRDLNSRTNSVGNNSCVLGTNCSLRRRYENAVEINLRADNGFLPLENATMV